MEEAIGVLGVELPEVLQLFHYLHSVFNGCIGDYMEVVVSALVQKKLLSSAQGHGSLEKVEYLLKQLSIEIFQKVERPVPDVIILVGEEELVRLDLLYGGFCCLGVSLLQEISKCIEVLVQVNFVRHASHTSRYLLSEFLNSLELFRAQL